MTLLQQIASAEDAFNRLASNIQQNAPPEIREILFQSRQTALARAILADLIDVVPVIGDISNGFRIRDATTSGKRHPKRLARQVIDLIAGAAPDPLGGIIDLLTPTNTITYLESLSEESATQRREP